jgi:hypothetical protein
LPAGTYNVEFYGSTTGDVTLFYQLPSGGSELSNIGGNTTQTTTVLPEYTLITLANSGTLSSYGSVSSGTGALGGYIMISPITAV